MRPLAKQVFRFSAVGVLNTGIGLCMIWLAMWLGTSPIVSNVIGYSVGLIASFGFNRSWTFQREYGGHKTESVVRPMSRFFFAFAVAWLLNIAVVSSGLSMTAISPYFLQLAGMMIYTVSFFVFCRFWVFAPRGSAK